MQRFILDPLYLLSLIATQCHALLSLLNIFSMSVVSIWSMVFCSTDDRSCTVCTKKIVHFPVNIKLKTIFTRLPIGLARCPFKSQRLARWVSPLAVYFEEFKFSILKILKDLTPPFILRVVKNLRLGLRSNLKLGMCVAYSLTKNWSFFSRNLMSMRQDMG